MKIKEIIQSPQSTFKVLRGFANKINKLQDIKEQYTLLELLELYNEINKKIMGIRSLIRASIVSNKEIFEAHREFASQNLHYDILLDGWSFDTNKAIGNQPIMAFIPYIHQVPIIEAFEKDEKFLHIEKARRQGISKLMGNIIKHLLVHGQNEIMYATHKDLESLDMLRGDVGHNSTFDYVRWLLDMSMWVPGNWREGNIGSTKEKQINLNNNVLLGAVLGKGTAVGAGATRVFVDEFDVVCDMYPNQANAMMGSFSASMNYIYLFSTYRSMEGPFYKLTELRPQDWSFYRIDWRDNPTCNTAWYNQQCAKLLNDEVLIARELDIDPTRVRAGLIWGKYIKDKNYFTNTPQGRKVIGADFGGGTSATAFVFGVYQQDGTLNVVDLLETTEMDEYQVLDYLKKIGYLGVDIAGDRSVLAQTGLPGHDWYNVLKRIGIKVKPVNNKDIFYVQASIRQGFQDGKVKINKNNKTLIKRVLGYNWKNDKTNKDEHSHAGDALCYLWRSLFIDDAKIRVY